MTLLGGEAAEEPSKFVYLVSTFLEFLEIGLGNERANVIYGASGDRMIVLRCIIFLSLTSTLALGQSAQRIKPSSAPRQPEAMVRNLYREVIARQPVGIPVGADMKVFAPYLSRALLHRIDLAIACSADWDRQNPDPNLKPEIAWLETGLFSGDNEKTGPRTFRIEKKRRERNGLYRVYVRLTWGAHARPWIWHVVVIALRENGRFVVDDVIYLKDYDQDDEWSLSESLSSGCDGGRWVGRGTRQSGPGGGP